MAAPADPNGHETVLVVEREPGVAELARMYLSREGYHVHVMTDPVGAAAAVRRLRPSVVVLDLSAGVGDEVARAAAPAPVVWVAPPGTTGPGPHGVPRPFSPRVLVDTVA